MRISRTPRLGVALLAVAALSLTACGDDSTSDTATPATGSGSSAAPSASSGGGDAVEGKVGVILPDTASSARWESFDKPTLEKAFGDAGIEVDVQNAQGDASRMQTIADQMITSGVSVLAIVNLDSKSGAAIQSKAATQGVKTLDYDRLTLGGSADAYISFDNNKVGTLQGEALATCLGDKAANIVYLNGSPDDNNATLFAAGAHEVLDKVTNYKVVAEQAVPKWDNQQAATIFEQMFTEQGGKIDGVLAANDGLGNAAISVLTKNKVTGVPVTGQDATIEGLQNVLAGRQCMTVYKAITKEAQGLVDAATAIIKGEAPPTTGTTEDSEGGRQVPSVLIDPQSITKENVKVVVDDGFVTKEDLCTGEYAALCTEAGIS